MKSTTNKELIAAFYKDIVRNRKSELIHKYVSENYIQHSPMGKDGRAGLIEMVEFLKTLPPPDDKAPSPIINLLAEGDFVAVHLELEFMGKQVRIIELFRLHNGMAAEHWDVTDEAIEGTFPIIDPEHVSIDANMDNKEFVKRLYNIHDNITIHHIVADGNRVAVHAELKQTNKSIALFDIFRMEDMRIAEHHYVKQVVPETMMHNNGMF